MTENEALVIVIDLATDNALLRGIAGAEGLIGTYDDQQEALRVATELLGRLE
jgi:hypothetical protein